MPQAIVAVFDEYRDAQNAREELISSGIPNSAIDLSSAYDASQGDTSVSTKSSTQHDAGDDSLTGRIRHFFTSLFDDDDDDVKQYSNRYMEAVRRGSCVLTVRADDDSRIDDIEQIMERHDAIDIDERSANWQQRGWSGYDAQAPRLSEAELLQEREYHRSPMSSPASIGSASSLGGTVTAGSLAGNANLDGARSGLRSGSDVLSDSNPVLPGSQQHMDRSTGMDDEQTIPVIQEDLKIGKRETQRGRVRVFSRLREQPISEQVQLREEHASIERRPVDRAASPNELDNFREGVVEIRETAEEPVVEKTARVREEVLVGKESSQRTETVKGSVRSTEVEVDDDAQFDNDTDFDDGDPLIANPNLSNRDRQGTRGRI